MAIKIVRQDGRLSNVFETTQENGVREFGWLWLHANTGAVTALSAFGIDPGNLEAKALTVSIVYAVLEQIKPYLAAEATSVSDGQ